MSVRSTKSDKITDHPEGRYIQLAPIQFPSHQNLGRRGCSMGGTIHSIRFIDVTRSRSCSAKPARHPCGGCAASAEAGGCTTASDEGCCCAASEEAGCFRSSSSHCTRPRHASSIRRAVLMTATCQCARQWKTQSGDSKEILLKRFFSGDCSIAHASSAAEKCTRLEAAQAGAKSVWMGSHRIS